MSDKKDYFFDSERNVKWIIRGLYICCGLLFILDFILTRYSKHPLEWLWGFYPIYGFVGCVVLVVVAKWMRKIIMREENFYCNSSSEREIASENQVENGGHS
ncbi:hypothetical protein [Pleionea litopenaei]|uniref:Uncharacterized protein n=1 Tax=Pleionea litopenaei TaxID=3070815 RepID=A0AA51RUR0_9GAMM|nr:hypothetical protein [Pleionea sp. HL-JVS1]WMS87838.1 hypothetical protein Q9312_02670 [Pleionea sp. HL-JVS1]